MVHQNTFEPNPQTLQRWQTETGGHMITPLPGATPMKPGSASLPFFGVEPVVRPNPEFCAGLHSNGRLTHEESAFLPRDEPVRDGPTRGWKRSRLGLRPHTAPLQPWGFPVSVRFDRAVNPPTPPRNRCWTRTGRSWRGRARATWRSSARGPARSGGCTATRSGPCLYPGTCLI